MHEPSIPLSVIVASIQGWPAVRPTLDSMTDQVTALGGEIIVMDGSSHGTPEIGLGECIRWISQPGLSVFQLRNAAYREARGAIVAQTEDHCRVMDDWPARVLELHRLNPAAVGIGGAVVNGTTDHVIDWAAFLVTQTPSCRPLANGVADRITGAPNVSFKRIALDRLPDHGSLGTIELFDNAHVRREGEELLLDDSLLVSHHQCMTFSATSAIEFHNGRTIAGFRRQEMRRGDRLRIIAFPVLPWYRTARAAARAFHKQIPRKAIVVSLPAILWLQYAAGLGEFIGYAAGPGDSPRRLR